MAREIGRYKWATVARQILWTGADILRGIRIWRVWDYDTRAVSN
jgi:hypothetical protein